jgi:hypothetical protein
MKFETRPIWYPSSHSGVMHGTVINDGSYRNEGELISYTIEETYDLFNIKK